MLMEELADGGEGGVQPPHYLTPCQWRSGMELVFWTYLAVPLMTFQVYLAEQNKANTCSKMLDKPLVTLQEVVQGSNRCPTHQVPPCVR